MLEAQRQPGEPIRKGSPRAQQVDDPGAALTMRAFQMGLPADYGRLWRFVNINVDAVSSSR